MFKRIHLPAGIAAALTLCSVPAFSTETCYDFSHLAVGTSYHIGDVVDISVGTVKIVDFIKDGAVFEPQNPIDQHLGVTQSQLAQGAPPEIKLNFVGLQIIPDSPAKEIRMKAAQQLGITGLLPAFVEINGELHDFHGSFNEVDNWEFGNPFTGKVRFYSSLVQDDQANGTSYWYRGDISAVARLPGCPAGSIPSRSVRRSCTSTRSASSTE